MFGVEETGNIKSNVTALRNCGNSFARVTSLCEFTKRRLYRVAPNCTRRTFYWSTARYHITWGACAKSDKWTMTVYRNLWNSHHRPCSCS